MTSIAGVFITVHTPRPRGPLASEVFRPVLDGLVAQGRDVAAAAPDVLVVN